MRIRSLRLRCGALLLVGAGVLAPVLWLTHRNPPKPACCQTQEMPPPTPPPPTPPAFDGAESELKEMPPDQLKLWQRGAPEPVFAEFQEWASRPGEEKTATLEEGVHLATTRRAALAALIVSDPARALELAVPEAVRRQMPAAVANLLEERMDARGVLQVTGQSGDQPLPPGAGITRHAVINGRTFAAHVYGRRAWQPTRWNIPLHGIALDGVMAVSEWPARVLEPVEREEARAALTAAPVCPTSQVATPTTGTEVALRVALDTQFYCGPVHAAGDLQDAAAAESLLPPGFGRSSDEPVLAASDGTGIVIPSFAPTSDAAWTTGSKKLLFVRVDFQTSTPGVYANYTGLTATQCGEIISSLDEKFNAWSYGKLRIKHAGQGSTVSAFVHLGPRGDYYEDDVHDIWDEVSGKLGAQGLDEDDYDYLVVQGGDLQLAYEEGGKATWGGKGLIGGGRVFMQVAGESDEIMERNIGTCLHELGHNLGLYHSSVLYPYPKQMVIGGFPFEVIGEEYGDMIDRMGRGGLEFNVRYKHWLHWLDSTEVPVAPGVGRFTLLAHDLGENGGVRGLQVPVVPGNLSGESLIVEYRTSNANWLPGLYGAGIRLTDFSAAKTWLLDATPETFPDTYENLRDSPLTAGRTFAWSEAGQTVYLTTISADPLAEKLVVQVNRGPFAGNHAPTGSLSANPAVGGTGKPVAFTAAAADADGDELAYSWNLGVGPIHPNSAIATRSFADAGTYPVTCIVSDMKGGTVTLTMNYTVSITSPPDMDSFPDQVTDEDVPLENLEFLVSDAAIPAAAIVVTASSNDQVLVPDGNIVITHAGDGKRSITITPGSNQHGTAWITVTASNGVFEDTRVFALDVLPVTPGATLISKGAVWRYHDAGAPPPHDWMAAGFSDATWPADNARFVFGQGGILPFGSTTLATVPGRISTYFRRHFTLPAAGGTLTLRLLCDDGAVVYLNGTAVHRQNMPDGAITHTTRAVTSVEGAGESEFTVVELPLSSAVIGDNLLAVEVHDSFPRGTGDVSFDATVTLVDSPVVSDIRDQTTPEDTTTLPILFEAADAESPGDTLTFSLECDPSWMILNASVQFGWNPILHQHYCVLTPQPDKNGDATITIKVSDGSSETRRSFLLTVTPVDDAPTLDPIPDVAIALGGIAPLVNCIIRDVDTPDAQLTVTATSSNPAVVPAAGFTFLPLKYDLIRQLVITPAPGIAGQSTITLSVSDGGPPFTTAFVFRVSPPVGAELVPVSLIGSGDEWSFLLTEPAEDLNGMKWTSPAYDDSAWSKGRTQMGYGDGDEVTAVPVLPHRITTYFRRTFKVPQVSAIQGLKLRLLRDDGAIVRLNGTIVHVSNMPERTAFTPDTLAVSDVTGADEDAWETAPLDAAALLALVPGKNVITVEVHQSSQPTGVAPGDLSFDLELEGAPATPPAEDVLIAPGGDWRYWDQESYPDGSWSSPNYFDGQWSGGLSRLGFGIGGESTVINGGPADLRHRSVLFRKAFDVADPALYTALHLMVQRDDGLRVYLNGVPVLTNNLSSAATLADFALTEISPADFFQWHHFLLDAASLLPGRNLIAVELHQASSTGPDLGFDLQLSAALHDGPPALTIRPAGDDWELRWPAAWSAWQLQSSTTMQNDWMPVPGPIVLSKGWLSVIHPDRDPRRFFRLHDPVP